MLFPCLFNTNFKRHTHLLTGYLEAWWKYFIYPNKAIWKLYEKISFSQMRGKSCQICQLLIMFSLERAGKWHYSMDI